MNKKEIEEAQKATPITKENTEDQVEEEIEPTFPHKSPGEQECKKVSTSEELLYRCIRELCFIAEQPCNQSDLHITSEGKSLVKEIMGHLGLKGLEEENYVTQIVREVYRES